MSARTPRLLVFVGTLVLSLGWAASVRAQAPPETIEYYATDAFAPGTLRGATLSERSRLLSVRESNG